MANMALPNVWHDNIETGIEITSDGQYWYVKIKETGDIQFSYPKTVDIFLVGGGGAGASGNGASGGGGGYAKTVRGITIDRNTKYHVEIGRGGIPAFSSEASGGNGGDGGETIFSLGDRVIASAEGGKGGIRVGDDKESPGGDGGSGGGTGTYAKGHYGGDGGSNAGNGGKVGNTPGGKGQAVRAAEDGYPSTTRAFGTGELYAGGGGGSSRNMSRGGLGGAGGGGKGGSRIDDVEYPPEDGQPNTGGGGGGQTWDGTGVVHPGGAGGSGVVIIRGDQLDLLPVWFNGVQLSDIFLNDIPVENMWFGDLKLF